MDGSKRLKKRKNILKRLNKLFNFKKIKKSTETKFKKFCFRFKYYI